MDEHIEKTSYILTIDEWKDGERVSYAANSINLYLTAEKYAAVMNVLGASADGGNAE